eukprot:TRINITY_DN27009_c0_g1_i1.p1 TRINITY_DN27009_c0_g1~~TRINITY_DN27009_c0_g1_i1.p1  ORF type:complete len:130 (-),score=1.86 TRINITY_DN27009_c0_g1_i1:503-892(-)
MARGKGAARGGKRDAVTVACTAWIIYRLIIEHDDNRSSIQQSLAHQEEGDTRALLLELCRTSSAAAWQLDKALQRCATDSSKSVKKRCVLRVILQYATDTLGLGLPYTVRRVPGKGLGIIATAPCLPGA